MPLGYAPAFAAPSLLAGIAVTSHDTNHATTAHVQALSLLPMPGYPPGADPEVAGALNVDVGSTGLAGNATLDILVCCDALIVEGAGADIWGIADSFEFVHGPGLPLFHENLVDTLDATHPFAKAGLMCRDSLDPGAPTVIVDVKPDGGLEFMTRRCPGCEMEFIAGAQGRLPVALFLSRSGNGTFSAGAGDPTGNPAASHDFGSVTVAMANPICGYAVTSHDT